MREGNIILENMKFESLGISANLLNAVRDMGFETATTVQYESIKIMNEGKDVIAQSQTGTGKTAAFGIPCLEKINPVNKKVQCMVLCPTRELAIQINEEFKKLLKYTENIRVTPVYGGQSIELQITSLRRGANIIIGTPGRVMDLMRRKIIKTEFINTIVLDEADEMLDMGFREDIELILSEMPENRQIMLYSATLSKEILKLAKTFTNNPEIIRVEAKEMTAPNILQSYFLVKGPEKFESLTKLLTYNDPDLSMIFCNTKVRVDELTSFLQSKGFHADGLHGDLKQSQRDKVMQGFRNRTTKILVATDVAARGIDVDDVDIVFNYDLPLNEEHYVHRIGRTGRAGKAGKSYTFVVGKELQRLTQIKNFTKSKILRGDIPTDYDIKLNQHQLFLNKLTSVLGEDIVEYTNFIEKNLSTHDSKDIAAALMKMYIKENITDSVDFFNLEKQPVKKPYTKKGNMITLHINIGQNFNIKPKDIVGCITNEIGADFRDIGNITIYPSYSTFDIRKDVTEDILSQMNNSKIKGKKIKVKKATGFTNNTSNFKPSSNNFKSNSSNFRPKKREYKVEA